MQEKYSLAFLVPLISSELTAEVWKGIRTEAVRRSCTMAVVAGRLLKSHDFAADPANQTYLSGDLGSYDGLILYSGAMNQFASLATYRDFLSSLPPVPRVHIGADIPGETCILVDNQKSMEEVVTHLIREHGAKTIAYIGGPTENPDAEARYRGYRAALSKAGLNHDATWETSGEFTIDSGHKGVEELFRHRGLSPHALVCVDDETAIGAYQALARHGVVPGRDVLVSGFDDAPSARNLRPPLSTVHQSFDDLGRVAMNTLFEILGNPGHEPRHIRVPAQLILRASCSCHDQQLSLKPTLRMPYQLLSVSQITQLEDALNTEVHSEGAGLFADALEEILSSIPDENLHEDLLFHDLSRFRLVNRDRYGPEQRDQFENACSMAYLDAAMAVNRKHRASTNRARYRMGEIDNIINSLHTCNSWQSFIDNFAQGFEYLHLKRVHLELQGQAVPGHPGEANSVHVHEWVDFEEHGEDGLVAVHQGLFFGDRRFGSVTMVAESDWVETTDSLAIHLGATIHRLNLMDEAARKQKALTLSLNELRATQADLIEREKQAAIGNLVAGVAHEINTPVGTSITAISYLSQELARLREDFTKGTLTQGSMDNFLGQSQAAVSSIWTNLEKAAQLVVSFKAVAVDQAFDEARSFNLREVLETIMTTLGSTLENRHMDFSWSCPPNLVLQGHPGAFFQIVSNLVNNSLVHGFPNQERGSIELEVSLANEGSLVRIEYRDNGCGIPAHHVPRLFAPFSSTRQSTGHTGLGLHLVYKLCTQILHGSVRFEPGLPGVLFTIEFPGPLQRTQ